MAESLRTQLSLEMEQRIDRKLYETGIPMTKEEWQVRVNEMLQKLGVTVQAEGKPQMLEIKTILMPITSCPTVSGNSCQNFTARKRNSLAIR